MRPRTRVVNVSSGYSQRGRVNTGSNSSIFRNYERYSHVASLGHMRKGLPSWFHFKSTAQEHLRRFFKIQSLGEWTMKLCLYSIKLLLVTVMHFPDDSRQR